MTTHGGQSQLPGDQPDGSEVDHEQQDDPADADGLVIEESAHRIHVGGDAFDQVTGWGAAVIGEAQPLDMVEKKIPQAAGDVFR